jgi:hypothetical protein
MGTGHECGPPIREIAIRTTSAILCVFFSFALTLVFRGSYGDSVIEHTLTTMLFFFLNSKSWFCALVGMAVLFVFVKYELSWYLLLVLSLISVVCAW